jgi:hypothetical protein
MDRDRFDPPGLRVFLFFGIQISYTIRKKTIKEHMRKEIPAGLNDLFVYESLVII